MDAAERHAGVDGLNDAGGALGVKLVHDGVGDLGGETFLHLGAKREPFDEAGELAESDDLAVGEVGDVDAAGERHEVVLAHRVKFNVAEEDNFVVLFVEDGFKMAARVFAHPGEKLGVGAGDASGSFQEAFAIGVFADRNENFPDGFFDAGEIDGLGGWFGSVWHKLQV